MDISSNDDFKRRYNHYRARIKRWEGNFIKTNGRNPSRVDIKAADRKIRDYYKVYWKLKGELLEQTILGGDGKDLPQCSETHHILKEQNVEIKSIDQITDEQNVASALKDAKENAMSSAKLDDPLTSSKANLPEKWVRSLSSKLFEGSSFKKRNPRKSLSRKVTSDTIPSSCESFTVNSSFMSECSFQSIDSPVCEPPIDDLSFSVENEVSPKLKSLIGTSQSLSPLFSTSSKRKLESVASYKPHPVSFLSRTIDVSDSQPNSSQKLDQRWIERCSQVAEQALDEGRSSLDSGFESGGFLSPDAENSPSLEKISNLDSNTLSSSDDEIIWDSDDEFSSQPAPSLKRKSIVLDSPMVPEIDDPKMYDGISSQPATPKRSSMIESQEEVKKVKFDVPLKNLRTLPVPKSEPRNLPSSYETNTKREILEKKMKAGTLNENYVKINMKKKVYVRGKRNFNFSKYKKSEWKKKNNDLHSGGEVGGVMKCFKCGDVGHFARRCIAQKEDKLIPVDETLEEDLGLPSLQEAEEMAKEAALKLPSRRCIPSRLPEPEEIPGDVPDLEGVPQSNVKTVVPPIEVSEKQLLATLNQFGHTEFRDGQQECVTRVLQGKSTLLMLSTGGGKSLCYQLPAYLYHKKSPCIALVVSPLVSLMDDQVAGSQSSFSKIGCLHANQTEKQRVAILDQLKAGELNALLVSPEAVVSCDNFGFGSFLRHLPPVAFACIDEVHCVSQWSYNFRPSYLMLTKVLRERFGVRTFLGLTATASRTTVESIVKELGITDAGGVIQDIPLPLHLNLSISCTAEKDKALLKLVKSADGGAIIVYCTRREECVRLATLIRTVLQGTTAEAYHAGLAASKRKSVQRSFMRGKLQVVVATVAFGMGINKQDIRCVFHYNMPKDWESYVQEVGRAGRDGQPAQCHLLLDTKGGDLLELRKHIYSNAVDRHILRRLLGRLFIPCSCAVGECGGHEVAFSAASAIEALDLPEENITTLLCYLELHPSGLIQTLTPAYMTCTVQSYHGARGMHRAARDCPPLAVAAAKAEKGATASSLTFDVIELARQIGWESGTVKRHIKQTEWRKNDGGAWRKTGMAATFSELGLRVRSRGDLTPEQLDEALDYLVKRVENQQKTALKQLQSVYSTFKYFSTDLSNGFDENKSNGIKDAIRNYFKTETMPETVPLLEFKETEFDEEAVAQDVRHLVCTHRDNNFNGRAVARIFHGIQSPNFPAMLWFKARQWRAHMDKDFDRLQSIASREILRLK